MTEAIHLSSPAQARFSPARPPPLERLRTGSAQTVVTDAGLQGSG